MLEVFIDTNVYLTFFSFTEEDLEQLRKPHVAAVRNMSVGTPNARVPFAELVNVRATATRLR
jgi:hypothetical protein